MINVPLLLAESVLLFITLLCLPIYAALKANTENSPPLKGLGLPQGTVRSMLAITLVGSFVIFLIFGHDTSKFTEVVAALTGIAGTIVGF